MTMRKTMIAAVLMTIIGTAAAVYTRTTMTDKQQIENYEDMLQVAQAGEFIAFKAFDRMREELPDCPVILRVRPLEKIEYTEGYGRQLVYVEEVYQGEADLVETELYLVSSYWFVGFFDPPSVGRGFVNFLQPEDSYLVFCSGILSEEEVIPWEKDIKIVRLYDDITIIPVFCYEDKAEVIGELSSDGTTYTPYEAVKENELFAVSEEIFAGWREIKEEMLNRYPK